MPKVHQFPYNKETAAFEYSDLIVVAVKEAEHAYLITGNPMGIKSDLSIEVWREGVAYIETVGVTATARSTEGHIPEDNPTVPAL